jgi:hypothetical protein
MVRYTHLGGTCLLLASHYLIRTPCHDMTNVSNAAQIL